MILKRSSILFWDICHLFWDTRYWSNIYFGTFEKIIQGYGIFGVNYLGKWDIGYTPPRYLTSLTTIHSQELYLLNELSVALFW